MENKYKNFRSALLDIDRIEAGKILMDSILQFGKDQTVDTLIVKSLKEIGDLWGAGELALSQIYMAGKICEELVEEIFGSKEPQPVHGTNLAMATLGDYHLLGKKIVLSVLRSAGYSILDLGHGLDTETLKDQVIDNKICVLLISSLMLPSALLVRELRDKFLRIGYEIKILVGGAPFIFDLDLYKEVGADAFGRTPGDAIDILLKWSVLPKN